MDHQQLLKALHQVRKTVWQLREPEGFRQVVETLREQLKQFGRLGDLQAIERRAQETEALAQAIAAVAKSRDLEEVLQVIAEEAAKVMRCPRTRVLLYAPLARALVARAAVGFDREKLRLVQIPPGQGLAGYVFTTGKPHLLNSLNGAEIPPLAAPVARLLEAAFLVPADQAQCRGAGVPLRADGQVIGVLVAAGHSQSLSRRNLELLERLGEQASLAIERARRARALEQELNQSTQLRELAQVDLGVQRVLNQVTRMEGEEDWHRAVAVFTHELRSLVQFHQCGLQFIDQDTDTFTTLFTDGPRSRYSHPYPLSPSLRQVLETGTSCYRPTRQEIERLGDRVAAEICSIVDVPFLGGTVAMNSQREQAFTARDIRILAQFARALSQGYRRLQDLRRLREKEIQLHQAQKLEAVGQLTAGIAHNFNNLLQALILNAEHCQAQAPEVLTAPLDDILTCAGRAGDLVRQLMIFSRQQASAQYALVDLRRVVVETVALCRRTFAPQILLTTELPPQLPAVLGDATLLAQVLLDLCLNARDALEEARQPIPRLLVRVASLRCEADQVRGEGEPGTYLCLQVEDNGTGMDEPTKARIFDPFFTTKEVGKGTGLGLSTAFGIVGDHGGWIECRSALGQGATFSCYLPAAAAGAAEAGN